VGRLQGRDDSPLTARGRAQAASLAAAARSLGVRHVCASPLGRALATARGAVEACGASLSIHDALMEVSFGDASGGTVEDAAARWPEWRVARERDLWNTRWPNGESYADAAERVRAWVASASPPWTAQPTLVVAHQTVLRAFLVAIAGQPFDRALEETFPAGEPVAVTPLAPGMKD